MTDKQVRFAAKNIEHESDENLIDEFSPSSDDEGAAGLKKRPQFNKFELLELIEGDGEIDASSDIEETKSDNDEAEVQGNSTAKFKQSSGPDDSSSSKPSSKRKSRKRRGKSKSSAKSSKSDENNSDDELASLAKAIDQTNKLDTKARSEDPKVKLLKVDMRNLIPEAEIKRIFGKGVVKEDKTRLKQYPGLQRSRLVSSGLLDMKSSGVLPGPKMDLDDKINRLRTGQTTGGRKVTENTLLFSPSDPIYFKFVHDASYQDVQRLFLEAVHQGNSEFILHNLETMPTHVESLIQLSHMLRVSEEYKEASEFIERALMVFERGFHPRFNMATAICRLSYKRPENRTFFITIFKHIDACHRRGLRRTPFEYSKLLLSLEPDNDPLMAVLLLDFLAIRSEEYNYLIDFYTNWEQSQKLPNMRFSLAMAHFLNSRNTKRSKEDNESSLKEANECLQRALMLFPNFIIPLLDACSGEPDSELKKCSYFDYSVYGTKYKLVPETVDVLVALYVKRTFNLWKQKHVLAWLERNIAEMVGKFASGVSIDNGQHTQHWSTFTKVCPKNLLRHVVLSDLGIAVPQSASGSTYIDLDPYPPTDSIISYSTSLSARGQASTSAGGSLIDGFSGLFFRSFLPSFSLAEQNNTPPVPMPTTSRLGRRNRPPQRPANTVTRNQESGTEAARATIDEGFDLDYESVEYSLLIDALRDLDPSSTQDPSTHAGRAQGNNARGSTDGASSENDSQLRRRQTPPS